MMTITTTQTVAGAAVLPKLLVLNPTGVVVPLQGIEGLIETSPGVRSCMIEYDQRTLALSMLLDILLRTEQQLPKVTNGHLVK